MGCLPKILREALHESVWYSLHRFEPKNAHRIWYDVLNDFGSVSKRQVIRILKFFMSRGLIEETMIQHEGIPNLEICAYVRKRGVVYVTGNCQVRSAADPGYDRFPLVGRTSCAG